ncbi:transmembrane channel-like protein 7 [Lingula anatina]|uniref:Transmembrane channel-like protein 7 n=1 Tax=Lingula anatina TaxID=7574 RepID=A0A1S3J8Q4_LINAN|nr:transmembrane channel-like protein 7 [Lingula anatina]|eukprot:XP_013406249.1 transmembrane channel-like protein 7 [Lingula anatina]
MVVYQGRTNDVFWVFQKTTVHSAVITYGIPVIFSTINFAVPVIINQLPRCENYLSGKDVLRVTILRTFILRISNLFALIISLYKKTTVKKGGPEYCVGTLIGQELYKLVIVDTLLQSSLQFLYSRCSYLWTREKKEFLMSSAILVIVYRQALIWTGTLACPVLPLVGSMSVLLFFAVNYSTVVTSCKPPENRWNQSRHSTLFIGLLTVTLLILLVPVAVIIGRLVSQGCS